MGRLAVVLMNLGGPDGPSAVKPFLFNLFRDPAIIRAPAPVRYPLAMLIAATRAKEARANYARLGGASPLLPETRAQAAALEAMLKARGRADTRVFVAMRYWRPFTEETAREVAVFAPDDVVLLPLYPQYSTTTTASSLRAWARAYRGGGRIHEIRSYPDHPGLVRATAAAVRETWVKAGRPSDLRLLFSAHGLPQRIVDAGDPYPEEIRKTAEAVAAALPEFPDWRVCFQSRVGPLKWLEPSIGDEIHAAGEEGRGVIVAPIAFVSEHVETLVELDHEYARLAEDVGAQPYLRAPAPGVREPFITALADIALDAVARPV